MLVFVVAFIDAGRMDGLVGVKVVVNVDDDAIELIASGL